jgi:hypothetical protein
MPGGLSGGLKIVVADFMYAAPVFQQAGTMLGDVASDIGESVAGLGSFWGNDAPGKTFAASYLPAQDAILSRLGSAAGAVTGVGDGLRQMAANYDMTEYTNAFMSEELAQAESGQVSSILSQNVKRPNLPPLSLPSVTPPSSGSKGMPHPDPQAGPSPTVTPSARPKPVSTPHPDATPTPDPEPNPPPNGKLISNGPGWWLMGIPWPAADSGKLFEAGDQWTRLANGIRDIAAPADSQAASIASNNQGKAVDAFENFWKGYGGRGGELATLAEACDNVATACYRYAELVEATKRQIEEAGIEFATVVLLGTIAAFFSFGATEEAADAIGAFLINAARQVFSLFASEVPGIVTDFLLTASQMLAMAMAGGFSTDVTLLGSDLVKQAFGEALPPPAEELMDTLKGMEAGTIAGPLGEMGGAGAENLSKQLEELGNNIASGKIVVADPAIAGQFLWLSDVVAAGGKAAADLSANAASQLVVNHDFSMQDLTSDFISSNIAEAIAESQGQGD